MLEMVLAAISPMAITEMVSDTFAKYMSTRGFNVEFLSS